jgi:hypothetical protein
MATILEERYQRPINAHREWRIVEIAKRDGLVAPSKVFGGQHETSLLCLGSPNDFWLLLKVILSSREKTFGLGGEAPAGGFATPSAYIGSIRPILARGDFGRVGTGCVLAATESKN